MELCKTELCMYVIQRDKRKRPSAQKGIICIFAEVPSNQPDMWKIVKVTQIFIGTIEILCILEMDMCTYVFSRYWKYLETICIYMYIIILIN